MDAQVADGAERLERREEVINEALAEEVRRREMRKKETDRVATAASGMAAESATAGWRQNPIEPDPNPKRRMLMKSASLTASSSSGHSREKRTKPDEESKMQVESASMPTINESTETPETLEANTRKRIIGKSEPVAVTTQEEIDGYREKARRIANVEQIELGNIMELSITSQLLRGARRANVSGGVSLCKTNGWNMKNHSHLKIARRLREKIHPMMLVVTIRKDEERGICDATLRELWRIVKDQTKEQTVVVVAVSKHSAIWKSIKLKSSMQECQLKYVDAEEMRVITNSKHVAEQIKSDRDKRIVMDDQRITESRKIGGKQNSKSTVMNGVKFGKVRKWVNSKIDEETYRRSEEQLCRSIMKGMTKRNCEKHAMLADMEEKQGQERDVVCFDDVTDKELPWSAVRKARELELKYLRDLGVYEKVDEKEAIERYGITPIDTKWIDTDKAFEGEPMQIRSRICAREFKSDDRPDLYAGTPPLEALKAIISIAANHKGTFSIRHIDVSRAYFSREGSETGVDTTPSRRSHGQRRRESWIDEEEHVWNKRCSEQLGT